ncbi:MAG TPA: hypothetical protein VN628_06420 [Vicinamibacterales bacterium]|nr:hypothetical protein [Vicinamibacterales bacterium]
MAANRRDSRRTDTAGLESALEVWRRRRAVALVVFFAVAAAAVSITVTLPDLYRATATVLVESQNISEEFVRSAVSAELETRIQTIREEVMSRERLGNLITRLDLYPDLRAKGVAFDTIIERMRRDIDLELNTVSPSGGRTPTIAFAIKYTGRNPRVVADVANMLASAYIVENGKIREGQAVRTADILKTELDGVKQELDAQDRRVAEFNLKNIGELPQQVTVNLATLERLNTQLRLNGENQVRAMDRRERLERQLADLKPGEAATPGAEPARSTASEELAKLRQQLQQMQRKYTDKYPDVIRLRAEIADVERQLAERPALLPATPLKPSAGPSAAAASASEPRTRLLRDIAAAETELATLKSEEASFRKAIVSYEQRVENVPKREEEFEMLSRDRASTKERYDSLQKKYEEAELGASLERGQKVEQFRILDAAIPPRDPAAPSRPKLLALGLFLALSLAVGAALIAEKLDRAFHSVDDLRGSVNVPALFSIPFIPTTADARRRRQRMALAAASVAAGLALVISASRHIARNNEQLARFTTADGRG